MKPVGETSGKRVAIIGGGLIGLATAFKLLGSETPPDVLVVEKEARVGTHQSGRNSGVLHCGLHYRPGSLRARLAVSGIREMVAFCVEHDIPHRICGKVVVATEESELKRLDELERRGRTNGLSGLKRLTAAELVEREPHASGVAGLLVPEEGVVDYRAVCKALVGEVEARGGTVHTCAELQNVRRADGAWALETTDGAFKADYLVGCAGLHADRVARMAGGRPKVSIVPFRGEYYRVPFHRAHLVRAMIYPVPDPAFPFLGVHLHRRVDGTVEGGPTAVLAFAREGYEVTDVDLPHMADAFLSPALWRFALRYPRMCAEELQRSFSRSAFGEAVRRLVPDVRDTDLTPAPAGVRAQAMTRSGRLVDDFEFAERAHDLHVLNAPSPAATASLAIGGFIAERVVAGLAR